MVILREIELKLVLTIILSNINQVLTTANSSVNLKQEFSVFTLYKSCDARNGVSDDLNPTEMICD